MVINETAQMVLETTKASIYNYSLIFLSLISIFGILLVTWSVKDKKKSWGDFPIIWTFFIVVIIIATMGLILMPNTVLNLINWGKDFLNV